jgi:hypothetical protein
VQLGDVPGEHLIRGRREKLGLRAGRMGGVAAAVADLSVLAQDLVHGGD